MKMVRGKHANRAALRRDREALAADAQAAAIAADRAERERNAAEVKAATQVESYQKELKELRAHLAAQTSPELVRALDLAEERRKKIGQLEADLREAHDVRVKGEDRLVHAIAAHFKLTVLEAGEFVAGVVGPVIPASWDAGMYAYGRAGSVDQSNGSLRRGITPQGRAIQRAKGKRQTTTDFVAAGEDAASEAVTP